jgi:hypothetical protein
MIVSVQVETRLAVSDSWIPGTDSIGDAVSLQLWTLTPTRGKKPSHFWYCSCWLGFESCFAMELQQSDRESAAMSLVNVSVGSSSLLPFAAGVLATEVYELLTSTNGAGILHGPNGIIVVNRNSPLPAGNYTYRVPSPANVPQGMLCRFPTHRRVLVCPYGLRVECLSLTEGKQSFLGPEQ